MEARNCIYITESNKFYCFLLKGLGLYLRFNDKDKDAAC